MLSNAALLIPLIFIHVCARRLQVGLHTDEQAMRTHGPGNPIMTLHERALCVLACKYVDDVILGTPWNVTRDLCTSMNVALVVAGSEMTTMKRGPISPHSTEPSASQQQQGTTAALPDPYSVPKEMGIFREVECVPSPAFACPCG